MLIFICMFILILSTMVMSLASIISKKSLSDKEKNSSFECGFDPISSSRIPFSIQFFLIAIIFLIFDVEIALIFPLAVSLPYSNIYVWSLTAMLFIFILLLGLYHEWNQGALQWL